LPLLGMITNCFIPDIAMLRWIAYIKSLNPVLVHIIGKKNSVADMLSRARYVHEEEMETHEVDEDDDDDDYGYVLATRVQIQMVRLYLLRQISMKADYETLASI
jgi:hypothetical protein